MKLSNYLFFLTSITMINAQDDNPSGHELHDHFELDESTFISLSISTFTSTSTSKSSNFDDSVFTSTAVFDNKVSSGHENILKYGVLLWGFLIL